MSGRSELKLRALPRWYLLVILMGAALAAPFQVLELSVGGGELALPLGEGAFTYRYRQSIYEVTVREELRVRGDRISVERAISSDIRALEYFRWPGEATGSDGALEWRAPENATDEMRILVTGEGHQEIDTGLRRVVLRDAFGESARVTVRPGRRPLLLWLFGLLR